MFGLKKKTAVEESEPPESYKVRHAREVSAEIQRLKKEMGAINQRLHFFYEKNFIIGIDSRRCWRLNRITDVPAAEAQLRALERERDGLLEQWHSILHEHASLVSRK